MVTKDSERTDTISHEAGGKRIAHLVLQANIVLTLYVACEDKISRQPMVR